MKTIACLFCLALVASAHAQIKVDSNYTILARGADDETSILPSIYGNLGNLLIKEKASGKVCSPVSMQFTFVVNGENFHENNIVDAQIFLNRMKPKDVIYIENIKLPQDCFAPPKQIVITIQ